MDTSACTRKGIDVYMVVYARVQKYMIVYTNMVVMTKFDAK